MLVNETYRVYIDGLTTGYGGKEVLRNVTIGVKPGEIVALIGHNGSGKSTLLKTIFGLVPTWKGTVLFDGSEWPVRHPRELLAAGIAYVPQGNRIFNDLTVLKNLELGMLTLGSNDQVRDGIGRVCDLFPTLKSRLKQRAGTLSGGEKQMLALGNALVRSPRLVLLDEPSLGLSPPLAGRAIRCIAGIVRDLGTSVLVVEQKVREILQIAHRVYVLRSGQISYSGPADSLHDESRLREVYL